MKKVIVLILTLALLCSSVPVIAETELIEIEPNLVGFLRDSGYTTCSDFLDGEDIRTVFALLLMLDVCMSSDNPHPEYGITDFDTSCIYVGRFDLSNVYTITCTDDGKYAAIFTYNPSSNSINAAFGNINAAGTTSSQRNSVLADSLSEDAISRYKIDEDNFYTAIDALLSSLGN